MSSRTVALVDGSVSFEASHSYERMQDPEVRAVRERVQLIAGAKLMDPAAPRSGLVEPVEDLPDVRELMPYLSA